MARLLLIGLGPLGQRVLADLLQHGEEELAAVVDQDPRLVGRPVRDLDARAPAELHVLPELGSVPSFAGIDSALVMTSSALEHCAGIFRSLLGQGLRVVSSCEELSWPWLRHAELSRELDQIARQSGGALLGAGINPGFVMDALPLFLSGACQHLRSLRVERVQNAALRRIPFQKKIGAGLNRQAFEAAVADGSLRHVGLGESLHFLAHSLGFQLDSWREELEPVFATRPLESVLGPIPVGRAAGVRQRAFGQRAGATVIELFFQATIGEAEPHDSVHLYGEPDLSMRIEGGIHGDIATSALLLNALPALRSAAPGLHTMASVRPPHSRALRS